MVSTVQSQALPPVPATVGTNPMDRQWFVQLREKINTINATLATIGGNTSQQTFDSLSPLTTAGDMLTFSGGHNIRLGIGTTGQYLSVVAGAPAWVTTSAGGSPLTTKGDLYTFSTVDARLPVGTDGYVLYADSAQATGLKWAAAGTPTLPLTTKGDILGYSTVPARIPVGTDGQALVADSTQLLGVRWATLTSYTPPVTTKGDLFGYSTTPTRVPVGTDGQVLIADSTQTLGLRWGAPSNAMTLVGSSVLAAAATNITVSGLDLGTAKQYLVQMAIASNTTSVQNLNLFYNADTTATNYYNQLIGATGTSVYAARSNNANIAGLAASSTANMVGTINIILDISGRARAQSVTNRDDPSAINYQSWSHVWITVSNVTSLTLNTNIANGFAIGSYLKVYSIT